MNTTEIYNLADRYLAGQLNATEKEQLNRQLVDDEAFAKVFSEYLAVNYAAQKAVLMANFVEEDKIAPAAQSEEKGGRILLLRRLAVVAAILTVFVIGYWLWSNLGSPDLLAKTTQQIYQQQIYSETTMSAEKFTALFRAGKYEAALALLQEEYTDLQAYNKPVNLERQGFCYWQLGNFEGALEAFGALEKDVVLLPTQNPARYYRALTYWAMGNTTRCKEILIALGREQDHAYAAKAQELLEEME